MRILIIGGTGFLGTWISIRLRQLSPDAKIAILSRNGISNELSRFSFQSIQGDLLDRPSIESEITEFSPDVIVHTIAYTTMDLWAVLSLFPIQPPRIVLISSGDVYHAYDILLKRSAEKPDNTPLVESSPLRKSLFPYRTGSLNPGDPGSLLAFEYDKIPLELMLKGTGDYHTIIRLPAVYGPGDSQGRFLNIIRRILDGRTAIPVQANMENWIWSKSYVENAALAIALGVLRNDGEGKTFHVSYKESFTEMDWNRTIAELMDWHGEFVSIPDSRMPDGQRMDMNFEQNLELDSSAIRSALGYEEMHTRETGLEKTIEYYRLNRNHLPEFDYTAENELLKIAGI